jgi:hypothetical protein
MFLRMLFCLWWSPHHHENPEHQRESIREDQQQEQHYYILCLGSFWGQTVCQANRVDSKLRTKTFSDLSAGAVS